MPRVEPVPKASMSVAATLVRSSMAPAGRYRAPWRPILAGASMIAVGGLPRGRAWRPSRVGRGEDTCGQ